MGQHPPMPGAIMDAYKGGETVAYDCWNPEKPLMDLKSLTLRTRQTRLLR